MAIRKRGRRRSRMVDGREIRRSSMSVKLVRKVVPKKPGKPVQKKPVKLVKPVPKKPVKLVQKKPVKPVQKKLVKLVKPVLKKPVKSVQKKPVKPVQKKPVKPVQKKPVKPVQKKLVKLVKLVPKKPAKPVQKKPVKPVKPVPKKPVKPVRKVVVVPKKPVKPVRKVPKKPVKPVRKVVVVPKKPVKPVRKRRRRRPRGPLPPLPAGAKAAETLMLVKLEEAMGLVVMMFPGTSMAIKSAINSDWSVDGELRMDNLPDELRTMDGMLEIIASLSESFRAFRPFPQVPDMGGKYWVSFGVRFGPNNDTEIGKLEDLYKKFRGLFQTGTYPAFAWNSASIQSAIAPGLKTIFEGVARRMGIPPSTLLIRFVWTPGPRKPWKEIPRLQQSKQRPGHWEGEGGKGR